MSEKSRCQGFILGWNACLQRESLSDDGPEGEDRSRMPLEMCEARLKELESEPEEPLPTAKVEDNLYVQGVIGSYHLYRRGMIELKSLMASLARLSRSVGRLE